ncbi:MAG: aminotransferase class V-fold PLP-dependent enzyme [Chloroflexi bacterium]|nr:aminotransferase class V-fold PLP-dependent enzyme [Chloroflexota bacterium]MYD49467.1 aminotransferase class V-fold PLP-dependent enzyme [Chloroflexota bacterium]
MNQRSITDAEQAYRRLGVAPIINASGSVTRLGGSRTRPEVLEQMAGTARVMVNIDQLNEKAGEEIARLTGAEAGLVTSGAAGGLLLQAAACIAGNDPVKMHRLPDTDGMKNEIVMQTMHRFPYDHAYRAAGAKIVEIGDYLFSHPWQLEGAINERTAAVAYLCAPFTSKRVLPLAQVCEIAHAHDVPVIVDAASMLPPRANLHRYLRDGADMVIYSGGKGVRGPQGTGILCGRADLIAAARANASPAQFIGRGMKVAKEEVVGLVTALAMFVDEDEEAEMAYYHRLAQRVVDSLAKVPNLNITLEHDGIDYLIPNAVLRLGGGWPGPSAAQVAAALQQGDPPIYLQQLRAPDELMVDPLNLTEGETDEVIRRLRQALRT